MRRKLFMLAFVMVATVGATFTAPQKAEASCNKTCCGANDCSCCTSLCRCPSPGK